MRQTMTLCAVLAALAFAAPAAMAEGSMSPSSTSGKFCLNGPGSAKSCKYDTMAACEKDKKTGQQCAANPSTTGTGSPSGMKK